MADLPSRQRRMDCCRGVRLAQVVLQGELRTRMATRPIPMSALARLSCVAWVLWAVAPAFAAHPMLTEDPATQGKGRFELELGQAFAQGDPQSGGRGTEFAPQLSYGATGALDLIVRGTWDTQAPAQAPTARGFGDTMLDFKWRFHDEAPLALAVRAGADLPTGAEGLGAGRVGFHAVAIAGWQAAVVNVNANLAYARVNQPGARPNLFGLSMAVVGPNASPWRTFIEATAVSNPDAHDTLWPAVARTGLIVTVAQWLDLDAGYQMRLTKSATRQVWLAGATFRW